MPVPVVLSPRLAAATRDLLVGDHAVASVVYDLALDPDALAFDPAARFVAVHRAPGDAGDFVVLGGLPSADAANLLALNARALGLVS